MNEKPEQTGQSSWRRWATWTVAIIVITALYVSGYHLATDPGSKKWPDRRERFFARCQSWKCSFRLLGLKPKSVGSE